MTEPTLLLDLPATVSDMEKNWSKVSYSKLNSFKNCQAGWFASNFCSFIDSVAHSQEESAAVGGTLVQRIWESFVNDHIFREFKTVEDRVKWMSWNHMALWHTIVFPYEAQFERSKKDNRYFFKSPRGQERLTLMTKEYGLDPRLYTNLQPKFVSNPDHTHRKQKTFEEYGEFIKLQYEAMLNRFASLDVDFEKMISEVFFNTKFLSHTINGSIDFVYNTNGAGPFFKMGDLKSGYIILDGKLQIGPTVSTVQLDFYTTALYTQYRCMPGAVGFIDWSASDFVWHSVSLETVDQIQRSIGAMQQASYIILQSLKELVSKGVKTLPLVEVSHIVFKPSSLNCRFCSVGTKCQAAKDNGTNRLPPKPKEETIIDKGLV